MAKQLQIVAHRRNATDQFLDAEIARWFECDIRATKDGVPVLLHDENVPNLPVDRAEVWRYDFARYDDLYTLESTLDRAKIVERDIGVMAEIKPEDPRLVDRVIAHLRTHRGPWKILSFVPANLHHARSIDPAVNCVLLVETADQLQRAIAEKWSEVYAQERLLNAQTVAQLRANDATVGAWTVNDPIDVWRLSQLAVEFLITDNPRMARDVLEKIAARTAAAGATNRDNPPKIG